MGTCLKVLGFCILITLAVQENPWKLRHKRDVNPDVVVLDDILKKLSGDITNVVDKANGADSIKKSIEGWVKEESSLMAGDIVKVIANKLKDRLKEKIEAVRLLSAALTEAIKDNRTREQPYHRCCDLPSKYKVTYDQRYKYKVTDSLFCQMKAPAHSKENDIEMTNVRTVLDKNKFKVKWQYFGSINGITFMFPAANVSACNKFENRIRPWYVTTATPSPKNIVILLDSSTSMGSDDRLDAAKETAKIVVSTLNPQDKVSVILFNASIFIRADNNTDECYDKTMPFAELYTIKYLKSFIDHARPIGGTRFIKAFKKAFEILKNTLESSKEEIASRPSMILLFTDGEYNETTNAGDISARIKKEVEEFHKAYPNTKFKLLALKFGKSKTGTHFITTLTKETNGISLEASEDKDPYSKLKVYFDHLMKVTPAKKSAVVFSPPYVDGWGLGFMVTAASAYFHNEELRGVAGVDILMPDLLTDVQYFNQGGPKSYAFLFHAKSGYTLSHPKLPIPEAVTEDPKSVNILELEQGKDFKNLMDEVTRSGKLSERTLSGRKRSISRGSMLGDGVQTEQVDYKYACMPADKDPNSQLGDYIVCVALEKGDTSIRFEALSIANGRSHAPVTYHRMDVLPTAQTCYYTDTVSYADRSVIKFSTRALEDPSKYLEDEDSPKAVKEYVKELIGRVFHSEITEIFNTDAIMTATLTSIMDETWLASENQREYLTRFVRRYIGTYNGVLRLFPGAPLPTNFDHVSRPWYFRAVANEGSVSLTAPYLDPLGAGFIVSISQSLKTSYGLKEKKHIFGVIGADLTVSNFGAMFRKRIGKKCLGSDDKLRCFIVDSNGYVIYHPNFDDAYNDSSKVLNKHITETDAGIARDMIKSKVMVRRECQNFNVLQLQRFYEIKMVDSKHTSKNISRPPCDSYAIIKVPETNVFVIVTKRMECLGDRPSCPCHDTCTSNKADACECPCKTRLEYNYCDASLTGESDIPVCTQPSPLVPERPPPDHPADREKCFSAHCGSYHEQNDCNMVFGCFWCYKKKDGSIIEPPSCKSDRICYGGVMGQGNPFLLPHKERKPFKDREVIVTIFGLKLNKVTLIAFSAALGVIVLISIVTIRCLCKRKNTFGTMDMFAVGQQPQLMGPTTVLTNDPAFGTLQLNYPGQSTVMQSNMQMSLRGPRMNYSTQAMSGIWAQGYGQSQIMSFGPQMSVVHKPVPYPRTQKSPSAMQAHGAHPRTLKSPSAMRTLQSPSAMQTTGAYPGTPNSKRSKPKKTRKVSFSNDEQEPDAVFVYEDSYGYEDGVY